MKFLENLSISLSKKAGKAGVTIQKYSPEILLGIGIVSFAGTVVMACKATLTAQEILEDHNEKMKNIQEAIDVATEEPEKYDYDEELIKHDKMIVYTQTTVDIVKAYTPSIALACLSLACILTSRNIMHRRYLGVVAAYNAVSGAFETFKNGVRERYGDQVVYDIEHGIKRDTITTTTVDENGKKVKEKTEIENIDQNHGMPSPEAVFFDSTNPNWDKNPEFSMFFLRAQQNYMNDLLHTRGHLFLNEVYDALGFPHTQSGSVLGWVEGLGDDYVDFGLYDINSEKSRRFVNGQDNVFLLDFNHDGVIWDKI